MLSNLSNLKPMQKYNYLKDNEQECEECLEDKSLTHFYNKEQDEVLPVCKRCIKKILDEQAVRIAMTVFNNRDDII